VDELERLSSLIRAKNEADQLIAELIGRPAQLGHAGEYIASLIFDIKLHRTATHKGSDGVFASGPLTGRSVEIKWYAKQEGILDIHTDSACDFYLVMTGPVAGAVSSRGAVRPWCIAQVYLFATSALKAALGARQVQIGIATSVTSALWRSSEIYPEQRNPTLVLTDEQQAMLKLFACPAPLT
jgi:hypothetical protein